MRPNPQETADLVTFTEEIHNGKFYFLCIVVGMANQNIYLKDNFNLLLMKVTQINFLHWQNVHI